MTAAAEAASLARGAAEAAVEAASAIQAEYRLTFEDHCCRLRSVRPSLVVADFPNRERRHWLAGLLNRAYGSDYLLVNLSGETYDTTEFHGPVMDVAMSGCVPPVDVLLRLCVSVHAWLSRAPELRRLVAHGAEGDAARSLGSVVVLVACYLSWVGEVAHPVEGLIEVCEALGLAADAVWPSQRRYLAYFELLHRGEQAVERPPSQLARVVLMGIGGDGLGRKLEIWQQESLLFRCDLEAEEAVSAVVRVGVRCRGDLAVRVLRCALPDSAVGEMLAEAKPELQVCFHEAFILDGFARFPERELDELLVGGDGAHHEGRAVDVYLEAAVAAGIEDPREVAAAAAAAAAVHSGPRLAEGAEDREVDAPAAAAAAGPQFFDLSAADDSPGKTKVVFSPEDIDSFFDDLL